MINENQYSKICNEILNVEKEYNLFDEKIDDVYFWKLLRSNLINEIMIEKGLADEAHGPKKKDLKIVLQNIFGNLFKKQKKIENLIFSHDRFFLEDNEYKDIYTHKIYEELPECNEIVYPVLTKRVFKNKKYNYSSIETIGYVINFFKKDILKGQVKLSIEEEKNLNKIKLRLENILEISEIKSLKKEEVIKKICHFKNMFKYYKKYLRKKNPKNIYLVCSYGKESLISAAKTLGIKVIEIQHGVMNRYHLGYHFPSNTRIPYFPDKLLMFGEYWYKNTKIPLKKNEIEFVGYPYLEKQLKKYRGKTEEIKNQVLFISQGPIGREMTAIAVKFAKVNQDKKIIIRLHPGEFSRWKTEYKILYENRNLKNIEISDNNKKNLYEYLFESEYVICGNSTVIYEALYLNKKVGILDLPGIEYVEDLIKKQIVKIFKIENSLKILDTIININQQNYFNNIQKGD